MKMRTKLSAISLSTLLLSTSVFAVDEYNVSSGVTTAGVALGLHGVDAVTLQSSGSAADGSAAYTAIHDGVAYYFESEDTKSRFENSPEAFLPQYGGFCAYAVSLGKKFDGDPKYADIVDDKLYLFVNEAVFEKYQADPAGTLTNAEKMWPSIQNKAVESL